MYEDHLCCDSVRCSLVVVLRNREGETHAVRQVVDQVLYLDLANFDFTVKPVEL